MVNTPNWQALLYLRKMIYPIQQKIRITNRAMVDKTTFINDETVPCISTQYTCCHCEKKNVLTITPYESGFPVFKLYHHEEVLSVTTMLEQGMVQTTHHHMLHLGEFTVHNLPTLYGGLTCSQCNTGHIVVFGYGEQQPGLTRLEISGVWEYMAEKD